MIHPYRKPLKRPFTEKPFSLDEKASHIIHSYIKTLKKPFSEWSFFLEEKPPRCSCHTFWKWAGSLIKDLKSLYSRFSLGSYKFSKNNFIKRI